MSRITARYWVRQLLTHLGILVTATYLATILLSLAFTGSIRLHVLWLLVTVVFVAERVITVRSRGWQQMTLASTLLVEMGFDLFLQGAQVRALWETVRRSDRYWK
jgi:hypothetical protein